MGFYEEDHQLRRSLTHTIAYTYRGLFELAIILRRNDYWDVLLTANERLLRRLEIKGKLAAAFDHDWKECADYVCLTGCAQLAGIWMRLYRRFGDVRFLNGALKALDLVKNTQILDSAYPGINGGVAGSFPVWGSYTRFGYPNWAAKFLLDGLLYAQDCVKKLQSEPPQSSWSLPAGVPGSEALHATGPATRKPLRVVLLSVPRSSKGYEISAELLQHNIYPEAVVLDAGPTDSRLRKAFGRLRSEGPSGLLRTVFKRPRTPAAAGLSAADSHRTVQALCSQHGIPCLRVSGINSSSSVDLVNRLHPDLLILAGAGILRHGILKIPRFGTLNAHMGLLPFFRGMNVAEWAALTGAPLGCSVHYVDEGVDTGRILATRQLAAEGIRSIEILRERVNRSQVDVLCKVMLAIIEGKDLPSYCQLPEQGRQFFTMHPVLRRILNDRLQSVAHVRPSPVSDPCPA
jgi:methionyl-tRNA formyltransferase